MPFHLRALHNPNPLVFVFTEQPTATSCRLHEYFRDVYYSTKKMNPPPLFFLGGRVPYISPKEKKNQSRDLALFQVAAIFVVVVVAYFSTTLRDRNYCEPSLASLIRGSEVQLGGSDRQGGSESSRLSVPAPSVSSFPSFPQTSIPGLAEAPPGSVLMG